MGDGEMVSMNLVIYHNTHGKMVKTPLINSDIVKAQENIQFSKIIIYSPVITGIFPYFMV